MTAEPGMPAAAQKPEPPRGTIAEWTVTILLLLFGTTTPGAGVCNPHRVHGEHAAHRRPPHRGQARLCSLRRLQQIPAAVDQPKRGDIIVFRYPSTARRTSSSASSASPGDRIKIINKQVYSQRQELTEPYVYIRLRSLSFRDNFPTARRIHAVRPRPRHADHDVVNGEVVVPPATLLRHGRQPRQFARQPLLGTRAARKHHRQAAHHLVVLRRAPKTCKDQYNLATTSSIWPSTSSPRRAGTAPSD